MEASSVRIYHPNRKKHSAKLTKTVITALLLASAALIAIILIGGWSELAGAEFVAAAWAVIYVAMAYFVMRWKRGLLPLAAGLATMFTSFLVVGAFAWFARAEPGLDDPAIPSEVIGVLMVILIAVQLILIVAAMLGFQQQWNIEIEVHEGDERYADADPIDEDKRKN